MAWMLKWYITNYNRIVCILNYIFKFIVIIDDIEHDYILFKIIAAPIPSQCLANPRVGYIYGCKVNGVFWYYCQAQKKCIQYFEGSCKPSMNDFNSLEACESTCVPRRGWGNANKSLFHLLIWFISGLTTQPRANQIYWLNQWRT